MSPVRLQSSLGGFIITDRASGRGRRLPLRSQGRRPRANKQELSPGAGLPTAEEQADAAFVDLLQTSFVAQGGTDLGMKDAVQQAVGDQRQDAGWTAAKSKGPLWEVVQMFTALTGGAHIVRRKDGSV